jgi:alkylated DNA repair dioxygenase AlkB
MKIDGLRYATEFISPEHEAPLLAAVDAGSWLSDLQRRVQHYGYRYDYKARTIDHSMRLGELPTWVKPVALRLFIDGYLNTLPDQLIVNEYLPGQGISAHIDCEACFGPAICSLSLASSCVMAFTNVSDGQRQSLMLERCSLVTLSGAARYAWTHAIAARKSDRIDGRAVPRDRRVSLTFRTVMLK